MFRHDPTFIPLKNKLLALNENQEQFDNKHLSSVEAEVEAEADAKEEKKKEEKNMKRIYYIIINFSSCYCWIHVFPPERTLSTLCCCSRSDDVLIWHFLFMNSNRKRASKIFYS